MESNRKRTSSEMAKNQHSSEEEGPTINRVNHFLNIVYSQAHLVEKLMKVNFEMNEQSFHSQTQMSDLSSTMVNPLKNSTIQASIKKSKNKKSPIEKEKRITKNQYGYPQKIEINLLQKKDSKRLLEKELLNQQTEDSREDADINRGHAFSKGRNNGYEDDADEYIVVKKRSLGR